ncbi:MAG: hypothetical protein Fur0037_29220 [Planctomycetota bacterium]
MVSTGDGIEDLLHRLNNLLGTIETQCEVARALDTEEARRQALALILESARKTQDAVRRFRRRERAEDP